MTMAHQDGIAFLTHRRSVVVLVAVRQVRAARIALAAAWVCVLSAGVCRAEHPLDFTGVEEKTPLDLSHCGPKSRDKVLAGNPLEFAGRYSTRYYIEKADGDRITLSNGTVWGDPTFCGWMLTDDVFLGFEHQQGTEFLFNYDRLEVVWKPKQILPPSKRDSPSTQKSK